LLGARTAGPQYRRAAETDDECAPLHILGPKAPVDNICSNSSGKRTTAAKPTSPQLVKSGKVQALVCLNDQ